MGINSKSKVKSKGKGKKAKVPSEIHSQEKLAAHGDIPSTPMIQNISDKMKQLNAGDKITEAGNSVNTSRSSLASSRGPKILQSVRKIASVRDTFLADMNIENCQAKASQSILNFRI